MFLLDGLELTLNLLAGVSSDVFIQRKDGNYSPPSHICEWIVKRLPVKLGSPHKGGLCYIYVCEKTQFLSYRCRNDHLPLNMLNSKVNNWAIELETFNITFEHISGVKNTLADTLSRIVKVDPDIVRT